MSVDWGCLACDPYPSLGPQYSTEPRSRAPSLRAIPTLTADLAGWGYALSRDLAQHAVGKANHYQLHPQQAPPWFQ